MRDSFGGLKFEWIPLELTPQWDPTTRRNRDALGYRWRLHYRWDCAAPDAGFSKWKSTFKTGYDGHAMVFTPMGKFALGPTMRRQTALQRRLGLPGSSAPSSVINRLTKRRGAFEFDVGRRPPAAFARYMTAQNKVDIAAWVDYRHYEWIVRRPGKRPLSVLTVSVPFRLTLHAFLTGFCLETPPPLPKGAVAQFSYPPLVSGDPKVAAKRTGVLATRAKYKRGTMPKPGQLDPWSAMAEMKLFKPDPYKPL